MLEQSNIMLNGALVSRLRGDIDDVFAVDKVHIPPNASQGTVIFEGRLLMADSETVYATVAQRWLAHEYTPILRRAGNSIELVAQPGVITPKPSNPWINLGVFVITLLTVLVVSALNEGVDLRRDPAGIARGLP
ncbi:MAG: hypothetical protein ACE5G8_13005, partial [Anaerolineae bacterium]